MPALRATAGSADPVAVLVRAFLLGRAGAVRRAPTRAAHAGRRRGGRAGLVETAGDEVRALVDLRPYTAVDGRRRGRLVDRVRPRRAGHRPGAAHRPRARRRRGVDHARAGHRPRPASRWCSTSAPAAASRRCTRRGTRERVDRHRHLGPRARRSRGSTRCWPASTSSCGPGSMLEPVAGERFDLVVSNPPFVITPRTPGVPAYEYRDGGRAGDAIVRELVEGVGAVLAPGGVAQLLGNWEVRARRAVARAGGQLARRVRAGRLGGAARAAGPRAVRRDVDPRRRHDPRPRPRRVGAPGTARGWTTSPPGTSRRSASASSPCAGRCRGRRRCAGSRRSPAPSGSRSDPAIAASLARARLARPPRRRRPAGVAPRRRAATSPRSAT